MGCRNPSPFSLKHILCFSQALYTVSPQNKIIHQQGDTGYHPDSHHCTVDPFFLSAHFFTQYFSAEYRNSIQTGKKNQHYYKKDPSSGGCLLYFQLIGNISSLRKWLYLQMCCINRICHIIGNPFMLCIRRQSCPVAPDRTKSGLLRFQTDLHSASDSAICNIRLYYDAIYSRVQCKIFADDPPCFFHPIQLLMICLEYNIRSPKRQHEQNR